ncbi:rRNA m(5)C methyltransferase 1 [Hyphodiscus hymeniophilus]|uniref:rRNA m(5)C methyltransferase 1 n=1 Tax=Hyphodiscus hymeniophilus TaxID=353542 RepID=A0A9P6VFC4_9HELO|nr:rRNA m(5)C methyltransferase 1 [Hyphodiscus hymeniophilus]
MASDASRRLHLSDDKTPLDKGRAFRVTGTDSKLQPHFDTDLQTRRLDGDGILSCRIKIPQPHTDSARSPENTNNQTNAMVSNSMDIALETTSPSSRRKDKIAEAIQSMANLNNSMEPLDFPSDPDAQATVTDFLDFTEYLPSDMMRSLTLIGNLDQTYCKSSANVHDLTKAYGKLPDLPADSRPDPIALRADISDNLAEALNARILSHTEACRMADNVDRHYNRAKNILAKLQAMAEAYPPSREPSPVAAKSKSPVASRAPKITLRVDNSKADQGPKVRKHRAPRITVPGEVLAPYELDYESYGSESDAWTSEFDEPLTPRVTPGRSLGNRIKLKVPKEPKLKVPKPPRAPRPPGVMGTNVHSAVAGISTSNALAKLKPPPADSVNGSVHKPWLQLTDWELASLRKRMKKNAVWSPSDTMIARELKVLGRGIDNYHAAKKAAEAAGQPLDQPVPPQLLGHTVDAEGAISVEALGLTASTLSNRGMKLNEAKKIKRETLAKQAAEEAEESARKMAQAAKAMKGLFDHGEEASPNKGKNGHARNPARKRKRESNADDAGGDSVVKSEGVDKTERPAPKRTKTETPIPAPQPIAPKDSQTTSVSEFSLSIASDAAPADSSAAPPSELSPKKSSTPILPPAKKPTKKEAAAQREAAKKAEASFAAANARPRRSSIAKTPTPAPEQKRPTSSRSKADSIEPGATANSDRPRRTSTARNTPAPPEPRQPRRAKRPAPGIVTASSEGSTAVSVGKRSAATRKKAGTKKEKKDGREGSAVQEIFDEVDDEGNIIDPGEPRYCLCNRCEKEWFHLECVGLADIPPELLSGIALNVGLLWELVKREKLLLGGGKSNSAVWAGVYGMFIRDRKDQEALVGFGMNIELYLQNKSPSGDVSKPCTSKIEIWLAIRAIPCSLSRFQREFNAMSLYYEAAEVLVAPTNTGGSLKSRIFSNKDLKSPAAQVYALAIETCKWSPILKEVIEFADIRRLERKLTPVLSLLLVHDLLLAKRGVALPATHGLRSAVERHRGRLQAELTKARIRRKLSTIEALKAHVDAGLESASEDAEAPYPRWVRINALKTTLEDQLDTVFHGFEQVTTVDAVRKGGSRRLYLDENVPNLVAISPSVDLSKSEAYRSGAIIFQDKASCFPAYLLDPLPEDGDIIDTCSAPGNKTTHLAAILLGHSSEPDECTQTIHAFEKNKARAETLDKMVNLAGSHVWTKLHPGQDFLKTNPSDQMYKKVGALLLDPSCSGSGIIGRDAMPQLHLPVTKPAANGTSKDARKNTKGPDASKDSRKRKREEPEEVEVLVDDDGVETVISTEDELKSRLTALSSFQLELLLHAFRFPAARKITYSTCSIHAEENESVVRKALESTVAKDRGWRILRREDQIRGLRDWPVRGSLEACEEDVALAESCIRANKGDDHGTMGFFLAGFVRDQDLPTDLEDAFLRDERGHLVRDLLGMPVRSEPGDALDSAEREDLDAQGREEDEVLADPEWEGFGDDEPESGPPAAPVDSTVHVQKQPKAPQASKHSYNAMKKRPDLVVKDKKRRKGKKNS